VGIAYILCYCQNAIDGLTIQTELNRFPEIHVEVSCLQDSVEESGLVVKLIEITGHSGIPGNEYADCKAKELAKNISIGKIDAPSVLSVSVARKVSTDIAVKSWQRKWDEDSKGIRTYELIPKVGTKISLPRKRDIGISYGRMLLNDTMLYYDSYRTGTADSPICVCGKDNETIHHILLVKEALFQFIANIDRKL